MASPLSSVRPECGTFFYSIRSRCLSGFSQDTVLKFLRKSVGEREENENDAAHHGISARDTNNGEYEWTSLRFGEETIHRKR